jgi:hypothetical protein
MKQLMENVQSSDFNAQAAGRVDFFPPLTDHIDQLSLSTTNTTYTIPTSAKFLVFYPEAGLEYAVRRDNAAVYPVAAITNGSGSMLSPAQLDVEGVTSIGVISNRTGYLTIAVYG